MPRELVDVRWNGFRLPKIFSTCNPAARMSGDAEQQVKACTHPQVKGAALALLTAIARLIPEGQTTTPSIRLEDLATLAKHTERTARTSRDLLERLRVIQVHDGGRGKLARYEIVGLDGARPPMTTPLPLRADLRPAPPRAKKQRSGSDLFSDVEAPTSEVFSDVRPKVGSFFRRWWEKVGSFFRRSEVFSDVGVPLLDLSSSRSEEVDHARARGAPVEDFLAWWTATFPSTVDAARDGPVVADLLQHRPFDKLQALAALLWTITTDGQPGSDRDWIARSDCSIRVLRHKVNFLELELRRGRTEPSIAEVRLTPREIEEAQLIRRKSYGGCPHTPRCATSAECVREIALARKVG